MAEKKLTDKIDFNIIRYANCWEDADLLLQSFDAASGGRFLSVASAGDNSFSLLTTKPECVVAVDINKIQLYLVELKRLAIKHMEYDDLLGFLGFSESQKRKRLFVSIRRFMEPDCREWCEKNFTVIENGVVHQGKFEKYFQAFAWKILPMIHSKKRIERFFEQKKHYEQTKFYYEKWNTWRWKLLFLIFFSRPVMGKFGRDRHFFDEVNGKVSKYIFKKAEKELCKASSCENEFLRYALTGNFGGLLPHYLKPENYTSVKENIDCIRLLHGYCEDAFALYKHFGYLNLSDIFEYLDDATFKDLVKQLLDNTGEGTRFSYWNLMVNRNINDAFPGSVSDNHSIAERAENDKGFFYGRFLSQIKAG